MTNLTISFDSQVQYECETFAQVQHASHIIHNRKNVMRYAVTSINKFISSHIRAHVVVVILKKGAISFIIVFENFLLFYASTALSNL